MKSRVSPIRADLLRILICSEPAVLAKVQIRNGSSRETPKKVSIIENGTVQFYYGSGPLWWQRLFNTYESVSIMEAAICVADAITGSNGTRNEIAFDGITKSILDEAVKKQDLDCVIDIIFDSMRNCSDGELHSKYINEANIKKYAKETGRTNNPTKGHDLYAFAGMDIGYGRIAPVKVGRITE